MSDQHAEDVFTMADESDESDSSSINDQDERATRAHAGIKMMGIILEFNSPDTLGTPQVANSMRQKRNHKRQNHHYNLKQKLVVLRAHADSHYTGDSLVEYLRNHFLKDFNGRVPTRQTVNKLLRNRELILRMCQEVNAKHLRKRFQAVLRAEHPEEEELVWDWFKEHRNRGIPVSGAMLKAAMAETYFR